MSERIIGVDFDNTIVSYDAIVHTVALKQGWIGPKLIKSKKQIRGHIRLTMDGVALVNKNSELSKPYSTKLSGMHGSWLETPGAFVSLLKKFC